MLGDASNARMVKLFILSVFLQLLTLISVNTKYVPNCLTSNNAPGMCMGTRLCPHSLSLYQVQPLDLRTTDSLRMSQCGFRGGKPLICCPMKNSENSPRPTAANLQYDLPSNPLLPKDCGRDLTQRIFGGQKMDLDEFPWMALLEYATSNGTATYCGGALISHRYVLTAAHCITRELKSVRLGEYNTATDQDCIPDGVDEEACADDPISVGIDEQIAHESYRRKAGDSKYDVAVLRLSRDVPFTDYIKAICLPSHRHFGQRLYVAGWGMTENGSLSDVKLKVSLSIADKEQCQTTYRTAGMSLGYGQMCAGGERGKDSCRADSGGPLISRERVQGSTGKWSAVGVVSFGPTPCGMPQWPSVYTRISDFVPWIVSKMRP